MGLAARPPLTGVVLHIVNQTVQFRFIPHTMVKGFILPEGLPGSAKNQVGWSRGGAFHQRMITGSDILGSRTWLGRIIQARS